MWMNLRNIFLRKMFFFSFMAINEKWKRLKPRRKMFFSQFSLCDGKLGVRKYVKYFNWWDEINFISIKKNWLKIKVCIMNGRHYDGVAERNLITSGPWDFLIIFPQQFRELYSFTMSGKRKTIVNTLRNWRHQNQKASNRRFFAVHVWLKHADGNSKIIWSLISI